MNLWFVRHGEILSNMNRIYAGRSSEGLTERGIEQGNQIAGRLDRCTVDALYTSPIARALETASIIGMKIGRRYVIEENFREMELGPWEGLSEKEVAARYPEQWKIWHERPASLSMPGRETLQELLRRVLTGIERIFAETDTFNPVIVTHVAVIRVLLLWHARKSLNLYKTIEVPNAGLFRIRLEGRSLQP